MSTQRAPSLSETVEFRRYQGGAPANLALNVAKLGGRSALIAKTGIGAFGQHCRRELSRFGVLIDYLVMDHRVRTTMVFVARTEGTPDFEVARQGDAELRADEVPDAALDRARLVHSSAFALSREPCRSAVRRAFEGARARGRLVSLDPNYHPEVWPDLYEARQVLGELYPLVDLTKPSLDDAERLFGPGDTSEGYVEKFRSLGARTVVLTAGSGDVLLSHEGRLERFQTPRVEVADATGAGDAFWAGFLVAWLDGNSPERCLRFAQRVT
ncbi:MAG: carbohydrate kinase, partial [Chloroflexota bacterium]|nr:carbohydrate kinase [Chloroflexota bacterium]